MQKLASVTKSPLLPSVKEQRDRAHIWGVKSIVIQDMDVSPVWENDLSNIPRSTEWYAYLYGHRDMMKVFTHDPGKQRSVFYLTPMCIGLTVRVAQMVATDLFDSGVSLYLHTTNKTYYNMKGLEDVLDQVRRDRKAAHQRRFRALKT